MPKLTIDGKTIEAPEGVNLIDAARLAGSKIPHYCYHRKLSVAGNCRICLVDIEKQPKLQIACNTKAAEGMVVHTQSPKVLEGRQSVLEFILVNHPIDCPICDQAGECKLQEYYMKHDLKPSRMTEEKVHKDKAVPLGPRVMLDMERCILCSRCIRFCQEIAHEDELCFTQRGNHTELTSSPGKSLKNAYSVNTVDICPVGALTSRDFRFKQRVWLLKETESICPGCSTGCNVKIHDNKDVIYRLLPRTNEAVNECWMCDEGRDTYKPVNDPARLRRSFINRSGQREDLRRTKVLEELKKALGSVAGNTILGIGSAQFTVEDNYALMRFLKDTLGVQDFAYHAKEVSKPTSDNFLISADKNPNRAGVEALGFVPLDQLKQNLRKYRVFFLLGEADLTQLKDLSFDDRRLVVLFTAQDGPTAIEADFVLPVALWAESDGTVVNRQRRIQRMHAAFPPPGEALPVWGWVNEMATAWGHSRLRYEAAEHVFADLAETFPTFKGINYEKIGNGGLILP